MAQITQISEQLLEGGSIKTIHLDASITVREKLPQSFLRDVRNIQLALLEPVTQACQEATLVANRLEGIALFNQAREKPIHVRPQWTAVEVFADFPGDALMMAR